MTNPFPGGNGTRNRAGKTVNQTKENPRSASLAGFLLGMMVGGYWPPKNAPIKFAALPVSTVLVPAASTVPPKSLSVPVFEVGP